MTSNVDPLGYKFPEPFELVFKELESLIHFVDVAVAGLNHSLFAAEIHDALRDLAVLSGKEPREIDLKRVKAIEAYADEQRAAGFSYLFDLAVVRLWSALSTFVDDVAAYIIENEPMLVRAESISRIKGPLLPFIQLTPRERAEYLVAQLLQDTAAPLKPGIGRFEVVLDAVGLGGKTPDGYRKCLLELSEVRNVIVHRRGRADDRFKQRCPWFALTMNGEARVDRQLFGHYGRAGLHWFMNVATRYAKTRDVDAEPYRHLIERDQRFDWPLSRRTESSQEAIDSM